jgi:hypothetical protein
VGRSVLRQERTALPLRTTLVFRVNLRVMTCPQS